MSDDLRYKRNRFSARLPVRYRYTRSHAWLCEIEPGTWRVGLTIFATRMLGETVEFGFDVAPGAAVKVADVIGFIEGFKAVSDLFCVAEGRFVGPNPDAQNDPSVIWAKPHAEGWLYAVQGAPDTEALDVAGYAAHLDETIDRLMKSPGGGHDLGGA